MRRAFTLVEALVVVAVIGLLAGVLLPALRSGMESARIAACASNLRQLQITNTLFAQNNDDRYAPGAPRHVAEDLVRWHGARQTPSAPFAPEGGPLTPYLESGPVSDALRECPSFVRTREETLTSSGGNFENGAGGYAYNNAFVGTERILSASGVWNVLSDEHGSRSGAFRFPARTVAFADGAFAGDRGVIEYSFLEPRFWPHWPSARPDPSTHFRHRGLANAAWLDGHVTTEPRTFTWSSGLYLTDPARAGIGWFGDADDNSLFDYE